MPSPLQSLQIKNKERWTVLQDIPQWEIKTIMHWLENVFVHADASNKYAPVKFHDSIVIDIETRNRLTLLSDLGINTGSWAQMQESLLAQINAKNYSNVVVLLECVVKYARDKALGLYFGKDFLIAAYIVSKLEASLARGSKWKVVTEIGSEIGLVERVDPGLTKIAVELKNDHLTNAWNKAFSVSPKPGEAIESSQRAIESIASSKGLTSVKTKIFGTLLGDIRTNPGNYGSAAREAYDLTAELAKGKDGASADINAQFSEWFWNSLDLIQKSNPSRHPSDATESFTLSPETGKQTTLIATLICELINSGYFFKNLPTDDKKTK